MNEQEFLEALLHAESEEPDLTKAGAGAWTEYIWPVFHRTAQRLELHCSCGRLHEARDEGEKREWLWDMVWTRREGPRFSAPQVLLEHENDHARTAFEDDLWKVLSGFAPLRVMVGYTSAHGIRRRIRETEDTIKAWVQSGGMFPLSSKDLILLRAYQDPRWHVLSRSGDATNFAPRCTLDLRKRQITDYAP